MFRPGTVNEAEYSPQEEESKSKQKTQTFGNIQKISQEGSKNTYVIILSKDCIKGESHKGPPVIKCPPVGNHSRALPRRPVNGDIQDDEFDSPTSENEEHQAKVSHPTEDVKLNLSNIKDEDYDSNTSATNVFLKPEYIQAGITQDSAIEADLSEISDQQDSSPNNSRPYFCEKSKMNTYVIPSPLTVQQDKRTNVAQHSFPMISPQFAGSKNSLLYNTPMHFDKPSINSTARKIFLVTPEQENGGVLKKSVAYTNEAVPTMGRSKLNDFSGSVSLLTKTNPKAVPTFNNISPINQTHVPSGNFVPINTSASPAYGVSQFKNGPFTSTPVMSDTNPRLQQLKHESSSHRPVYVIQSPFSRQISNETSGFINSKTANEMDSSVITTSNVPTLNNSSGFISGSSSLELFESSSSVDSPRLKRNSDEMFSSAETPDCKPSRYSKETVDNKMSFETQPSKKSVSSRMYDVHCGSADRVIKIEEGDSNDAGIGLESETEPSVSSSQESEASDFVDIATLNKSLTNMQWLKGVQMKEEKTTTSSHCQQNPAIPWKSLSYEEIKQISDECGREKRPPFSYMSMIQMALCSREDHKMMLKEICKWIEEMFPYFKYTAKPGWKNSIRHNLSLYNIFERSPAKRHGSYWTIRPDMEPRTKPYKDRNSNSESRSSTPSLPSQAPGTMIPIIPMYSSMGQLSAITPGSVYMQPPTAMSSACRKKGPPPILPRPSPYGTPQAYALIPINGVGQQFGNTSTAQGQQPMIVNFSNASGQVSACPSPGITEMSAAVASIQMSSPIPMEHGPPFIEHKHTKGGPPLSIVKQAWLDCQNADTASSIDSDIATSNDLTSSNEMASSSEFTKNRGKSKRPRILNPGLPKPTIYVDQDQESKLTGSKRRKLQQKERPLLTDSSDEEDEGEKFISNLVKDLAVPMKSTHTELEDPLTTSTPMKKGSSSSSTHLPSPISGFTPLRNSGLFDGSFLDTLTERKHVCLSPSSDSKKDLQDFNDSPNASILDFVTIPTFNSPDKFGEGSPDANNPNNLSKFLTECGLDPNFVENTETFPNLNWSSIQQIVDSMDTTE